MVSSSTALTLAKYALGTSAVGVTIALGGLWYFQRKLIYPSNLPEGARTVVPKPIDVGCPYEDVTLTTSDGINIKAYVIPARRHPLSMSDIRALKKEDRRARAEEEMIKWAAEMGDEKSISYAKSRPTVVMFHANAGNMGHRVLLARNFNVDHRCNVFMLSYRGYGLSEGTPSEHGLKLDIQAAMKYVEAHPILGDTKIILYGQSLGGAACLYAGSKNKDIVSGLILENTFFSFTTLIPLILPQIPKFLLPILLTEHWDASKTLPLIPASTPILFLVGSIDSLVKFPQMHNLRKLREKDGGKCQWRQFERGDHNDTCLQPGYWDAIGRWLKEEIEEGSLVVVEKESSSSGEEFSEVTREEAMEEKASA
ncbi:hypothetical protein B9479_000348 [Cryptococcus floricola]|uniref:AB hydrolase-1 domain-containing protein n=1 Tax=Cryptococcus floricola TaxID=2591691 RepID=A0A5D3B578_9TREE|nr:hypothetical protein B9479_000348 [Cryptococcus floricola]